MEATQHPFKTRLFQDDYIGNFGLCATELEAFGTLDREPEELRVRNYYPSERLKNLQNAGGGRFSENLEDNLEPELIEYCDYLVDRLIEIIKQEPLAPEEKAEKIRELCDEAKAKTSMDDILLWKEQELRWKNGPESERIAA